MQQLILLTGLSEYALDGDGQDYSMPPFALPQVAFRSTYPEIEYENGQMGHRITIQGDHNLPEHNRYCNMNGNYEFPESLFTWTGVAKNVVTVPDDAKLEDYAGYMPDANGGAGFFSDEVLYKALKRAEEILDRLLSGHQKREKRSAKATRKGGEND